MTWPMSEPDDTPIFPDEFSEEAVEKAYEMACGGTFITSHVDQARAYLNKWAV